MPKKKFYAVAAGRTTGIFCTWDDCKVQTDGFRNAVFKSFSTRQEAEAFLANKMTRSKPEVPPPPDAADRHKRAPGEDDDPALPRKRAKKVDPTLVGFDIYFDGGSRGNPGRAGCGALVVARVQPPGSKTITRTKTCGAWFLPGALTNNQAEYWGLTKALELVHRRLTTATAPDDAASGAAGGCCFDDDDALPPFPTVTLTVRGDSDLILKQMEGVYQTRHPGLLACRERARDRLRRIRDAAGTLSVGFEHVYRNDNTIADGLANDAMDAGASWLTHTNAHGEELRHDLSSSAAEDPTPATRAPHGPLRPIGVAREPPTRRARRIPKNEG